MADVNALDQKSGLKLRHKDVGSGAHAPMVHVVSSDAAAALPTGAATSAKQDTGNTSLASIDGKLTTLLSQTDGIEALLAALGISTFKGAANFANGQVALSTSAATVVAARATRRSVTVRNMDATISVYVGVATVSAVNGFLLKAGESISIDSTALIQGIAASGTPSVCYAESYD